jgi:membrane-associated phospholipid phosphatase
MKYYLILTIFLFHYLSFSQIDTTHIPTKKPKNSFLKKSIVPLSLIGTGLIINYAPGIFGKENLQANIQERHPNFSTKADDYLLYGSVVLLYGADILKIPSKNDVFTQTKYLIIATLANAIVIESMKRLWNEERPNGQEHSFPSGHTSYAFVMATVLRNEFNDTNPVLAYSGYIFATATGVLRVLNNAHWVSDVLVGAGIGMLVTELVYRFEPLKNWHPFKNKKVSTFVSPSFLENKLGLYVNVQF